MSNQPRRGPKAPWVVVAGGGTAGHVLPAIAVAESLRDGGLAADDVLFVGSKRGIEGRLVGDAKFPIVLLPGRGIQRSFTLGNVKNLLGLGAAFVRAFGLLVRRRPAVVFSVGGYASVPCAFSAVLLRIPLVLAESNARAGVAIKSVARFAKATATAFDGTGIPRAVVHGNPVRASVLALTAHDGAHGGEPSVDVAAKHAAAVRESSRHDLGVSDATPMLSVFGGSLGARSINEAVFGLCDQWHDRAMVIHHVIGDRDYAEAQKWLSGFRERFPQTSLDYRQIRYEDRMDLVYGASDVVVCRAGATSIADLAIAGVPAVLIPLPTAAEDHQSANASNVAASGASVHLPQSELSVERLGREIDDLLNHPEKREAMAAAQRRRARPTAAQDIADLLRKHAARREPRPSGASVVEQAVKP